MTHANKTSALVIFFWLFWGILLLLIPIYGFTLVFELDKVKAGHTLSFLSPVVGLLVFFAQIFIFILSFKQMKNTHAVSRAYLILLGGTIIVGLIWAGGCSIMGPWRLAG
jgi:hypothetical protein